MTKILVIDDNPDLLIAKYLKSMVVEYCTEPSSASEKVLSTNPDVIILDVLMPGTDGFTVAQTLRAQGIRTPIIFLSGRAETNYLVKAFSEYNASFYMRKPLILPLLGSHINHLLDLYDGSKGRRSTEQHVLVFGECRLPLSGTISVSYCQSLEDLPGLLALLPSMIFLEAGNALEGGAFQIINAYKENHYVQLISVHPSEDSRKRDERIIILKKSLQDGAYDFLEHPIDPSHLLARINSSPTYTKALS